MLTKRIIPCLDVKGESVVKGVQFNNLRFAGDPVQLAAQYSEQGADELIFLDISASRESRSTLISLVEKIADVIFIPFTVGGGIRAVDEIRVLLKSGADKVSINSAAVKNPALIKESAQIFGSQCIVVAIDAKKTERGWRITTHGGSQITDIDAIAWAKQVEALGAGEILLTSMDSDGTKNGFDLSLSNAITEVVNIPVIASGGAGTIKHFIDLFNQTNIDAALAASIFHYGEIRISDLKKELREMEVPIRS